MTQPSKITAGDGTSGGISYTGGDDGSLEVLVGPAGSKVLAFKISASGQIIGANSSLQLNTANGYGGAASPVIRRFTNVAEQRGTYVADYSIVMNATVGTEITINTADYYSFMYTESVSLAQVFGLSINSSQLTSQIANINLADRLLSSACEATTGSGQCSGRVWVPSGSIIRPHTNAVTGGTAALCQLRIVRG